jgi:hypothetical protein
MFLQRKGPGYISFVERMSYYWERLCVLLVYGKVRPRLVGLSTSEQDLDQEDDVPLRQVEWEVLQPYHEQDIANKKQRDEMKAQILYEKRGFCKEGGEGDGY